MLKDSAMAILPGLTVGVLAAVAYRVPPLFGGAKGKQWNAPPPMTIDPSRRYSATLRTSEGDLIVDLLPEEAPKTVNNFVFLAREGYYDGVPFHRIIPEFVIQGGCPVGNGTGDPGYSFQ